MFQKKSVKLLTYFDTTMVTRWVGMACSLCCCVSRSPKLKKIWFKKKKRVFFSWKWSGIKHLINARPTIEPCQIPYVMPTEDKASWQMLAERHWSIWNCVTWTNSVFKHKMLYSIDYHAVKWIYLKLLLHYPIKEDRCSVLGHCWELYLWKKSGLILGHLKDIIFTHKEYQLCY